MRHDTSVWVLLGSGVGPLLLCCLPNAGIRLGDEGGLGRLEVSATLQRLVRDLRRGAWYDLLEVVLQEVWVQGVRLMKERGWESREANAEVEREPEDLCPASVIEERPLEPVPILQRANQSRFPVDEDRICSRRRI